jgi:hypothetical protein
MAAICSFENAFAGSFADSFAEDAIMGEMSTVLPSELVGEDSVNEVACCRDSKSNGVVTASVGLDEPSEGKDGRGIRDRRLLAFSPPLRSDPVPAGCSSVSQDSGVGGRFVQTTTVKVA